MEPSLAAAIRDQLARYLKGEASLREFEEWFTAHTWDVDRIGDQEAQDLTYEIELRLAEFTNGHWTEDDLRRLFQPLVETFHTV